jgi:serine/threonine protein kinase
MLCGLPPFYSKERERLYKNIKYADPKLDMSYLSENAKDLCRKLLIKDPLNRLGSGERDAADIKCHPWFECINWDAIKEKKIPPPYKPQLDQTTDTKHFPPEFTGMKLSPTDVESLKGEGAWDNFTYDGTPPGGEGFQL